MSNDEDELGQCLLDEIFGENIGLNKDGNSQEILLNEDDEIKKFFESDTLNCFKIVQNYEQSIPIDRHTLEGQYEALLEDELKIITDKVIDKEEVKVQNTSKLVESGFKNKNNEKVISRVQQTNKEFINNVMSLIGNISSCEYNGDFDLKRMTCNKSDKMLNNKTSFLQTEMKELHESNKRSIIQNGIREQIYNINNKFDCITENKTDIDTNEEFGNENFNKINFQNSILSRSNGIIKNNELISKSISHLNSKFCLDGDEYYNKNGSLLNSYSSSKENNNLIVNNTIRYNKLITDDHFQQCNENRFNSINDTDLLPSLGNHKDLLISLEEINTIEKSEMSVINEFPIGDNIPISFSTGSGKKVSITEESLNRAKKIVGESPCIVGSPIGGNIPISFSTGSGKKVSITEESLNRAKKIVGESPHLPGSPNLGGSPIGDNAPISFSTGSGKKVSITEESLNRAKKIVGESPCIVGSPDLGGSPYLGGSPIGGNIPISFSTGSGKKVSITEESLNRAKKIVGESPHLPGSPYLGGSPIGGNIPISFSTGTGKSVSINEENLKKAMKLVDGFENREEKTGIVSNKDQVKRPLRGKLMAGVQHNVLEKTENNLYPNLLTRNKYEQTSNKKVRKLSREDLEIPEFFKNYQSIQYSLACLNSKKVISPTLILIDHSVETLKKYTFLLENTLETDCSKVKYIEVDFKMICDEIENFFIQFPIFPTNMKQNKQRWFEVQYMLILYDECLKWSRRIKALIKKYNKEFHGFSTNIKAKELLFSSLNQIKYPSVQKILKRICRRAIIEFFDAKRSPLIKICEGDFTVSAPLNLRILSYNDKTLTDQFNESNINRTILCTDGWYIIKIFTNFTLMKSMVQTMPRNIFACGGNWLSSNMEHGHPLEIEASTKDFPLMFYGINLIRPIRKLSGFKLGFHTKPLLFRISKLLNSSEMSIISRESNENEKRAFNMDKGGGLSFLVQVIVIHIFPICYKEMIETSEEDKKRIFITRDQNEMDISINNEIYEMYEKSFQQPKSDSEDSPVENTTRRISLESKLLVIDYWKYMNLIENNESKIEISDLINHSSILTLPSGVDIDEIASIKPGTVIRLSWMKILKNNILKNLGNSFSKLVPSPKTSLSAKKKVMDNIILSKILEMVKKPVLTFENDPENLIKYKGGWPMCILGLILQVYPIEERKRGFEHCFEFKVLLLTSLGSKVFLRIHSIGSHNSDLRMCERVNNKLKRAFMNSGELNYKNFIILIENAEFHSFERSTNLYNFNAKVPYSIFTTPYTLGEKHFSSYNTRKMLSKEINNLSFYTKCNIPKLFDDHSLKQTSIQLPICTNCENQLTECKCITNELIML